MINIRRTLNPGPWARMIVAHGEKGSFGLAMFFFLACVVQASRRDSLSWTPEDLLGITSAAEERVRATIPRPAQAVGYLDIARRNSRPVSELSYAFTTPFNPPLWRRVKRSTPEVYPVRELVASAGRGAFAAEMTGPSGEYGARTKGERWVCVTGLIENHRQTEAFRDAIWQASHRDLRRDRPVYAYFRVERAQIDPSCPPAGPFWVRQNVRGMFLRQESWPRYGEEPVDPRYIPLERSGISLVFPLGPLEDRPWGAEVCHPRIPVSTVAFQGTGATRHVRKNRQVAGSQEATEDPEYLLLRYFDYDVEPGRQYRYRVRLVLANPNHAVPIHCLEDESTAANRYLETEWSEPTAIVQVAPDTQVLAGGARTWGAPATVMLTRFLQSTGVVVSEEFQVQRGQLLDLTRPSALPSQKRSVAQTVDYASGMLLLDAHGGKRMPGRSRVTEPASLLLVDPHGKLVVRNELDDLPDYRSHQRARQPPESAYAERTSALRVRDEEAASLE